MTVMMRNRRILLPLLAAITAALSLIIAGVDFVGLQGSKRPTATSLVRRRLTGVPLPEEMPEMPEGGTILHVELCEYCGYLPNYGKIVDAVKTRFGDKVVCVFNQEEVLQELNNNPKWRYSSFEVVDLKSKELLHTKMGSGMHVTERKEWIDQMLDKLVEVAGIDES
eukprot:TRINITY_DN19091_c0_g1_i1.p1 TRINITY_DN19091_c0_g1~~TRINITY_DN19091_c0_g1_i1.p1  ORF type:complete len:167 (-),score=33.18 TRINITY_DN19091_c0_g1_i1:168-668(-)